jgi:hypothetical protein
VRGVCRHIGRFHSGLDACRRGRSSLALRRCRVEIRLAVARQMTTGSGV